MIGNSAYPPPHPGEGGGTYDLVIRTQEEFDAMISQSDWGGGHSVLLIGGTDYTMSNALIPETIRDIHGVNRVTIRASGNVGEALSYLTPPMDRNRSIRDIKIILENVTSDTATGFRNCINLYCCEVEANTASSTVVGFDSCIGMNNCEAIMRNDGSLTYGFRDSRMLSNCRTGVFSNYNYNYIAGFSGCVQLVNCYGYGNCDDLDDIMPLASDNNGNIFSGCKLLLNCLAGSPVNWVKGFSYCKFMCNCTSADENPLNEYNFIEGGSKLNAETVTL